MPLPHYHFESAYMTNEFLHGTHDKTHKVNTTGPEAAVSASASRAEASWDNNKRKSVTLKGQCDSDP